jgi:DNA transposition AAA+ family ATPase
MRNKQKRKKAQLKSEIMTIRTQIASRLTTINRAGDSKKCTSSMKDGNEREKYCSQNFADNYIKYSDCINADSFCYVCCENEFGDLHVVQRDACYTSCDDAAKKQ